MTLPKRPKNPGDQGLVGTALRSLDRKKRRDRVCAAVEKALEAVLAKNSGQPFTAQSLDEVEAMLPPAQGTMEKQQQRRHLMIVLKKKAEQGLVVEAMPDQIVTVHQSPSPFQPSSFAAMPFIAALARGHRELLSSGEELTASLRAGQILFSALFGGALLSSELLEALPGLIQKPLPHHEQRLWLDFPLGKNAEDPSSSPIRRWVCDPISTALILRWRKVGEQWPQGKAGSVANLLRSYAYRLGFTTLPSEVDEKLMIAVLESPEGAGSDSMRVTVSRQTAEEFLIDGAEVWWRLRIPSTVVDYCRNLSLAPSLDPDAWRRLLLGGRLPPTDSSPTTDVVPDRSAYQFPEKPPASLFTEAKKLRPGFDGMAAIRACLRDGKRTTTRAATTRLMRVEESQLLPVEQLLLHWTLWLVRDSGSIVVASAARYLAAIGTRLVRFGRTLTFEELRSSRSAEILVSIYDAVMADIKTPGNRAYAQARIIEFHRFLIDFADVPSITWRGRGVQHGYSARANLLTERDYEAIRAVIRGLGLTPRDQCRLSALNTLLFRSGPRRAEIEGRLATDVQGFAWDSQSVASLRPNLSIHAVEQSSLKSLAAGRRLPLAHLAPKDELDELLDWCEIRQRELGPLDIGRALLFGDPGKPPDRNDVSYWLDVLQAIARAVTGQKDLVIHHYRHSFLSLLTAKILAVEADKLDRTRVASDTSANRVVPKTIVGSEALAPGSLVHRLHRSEHLQRESLHLVARMGGHRDPLHTSQSYLHLMDWSLGSMTAALVPSISSKGLAEWCGMSVGAFDAAVSRDLQHRSRIEICLDRLLASAAVQPALLPLVPTAPYPTSLDVKDFVTDRRLSAARLEDFSLGQIYHLLQRCGHGQSAETIAEIFTLDPVAVGNAMDRAQKLAGRESRFRGKKGQRPGLLRSPLKAGSVKPERRYKFPEIPGLAPALPVAPLEMRECARVYRRLVNALSSEKLTLKSAGLVLDMMNRSNTRLWVSYMHELSDIAAVLNAAGISTARVQVTINSIAPDVKEKDARRVLRKLIPVPHDNIHSEGAKKSPNARHVGSLSVSVKSESNPPQNASGWKIGLFYAVIAVSGLDLL